MPGHLGTRPQGWPGLLLHLFGILMKFVAQVYQDNQRIATPVQKIQEVGAGRLPKLTGLCCKVDCSRVFNIVNDFVIRQDAILSTLNVLNYLKIGSCVTLLYCIANNERAQAKCICVQCTPFIFWSPPPPPQQQFPLHYNIEHHEVHTFIGCKLGQ